MTDAPKTNADLLDECLTENARQGRNSDELRAAVLARMIEPSEVADVVEEASPMALAKISETLAREAVLREQISLMAPKAETEAANPPAALYGNVE